MMRCFTLLLLLLYTSSSTCLSVMPLCNHHDNSNLLQFKNSFAIKPSLYDDWGCSSYSNKTASWNNGTNCCEWDGVTCNATSGHVIGLDLSCSSSMLEGEFHPNSTLFQFTRLQQLNLAFNDFSDSSIYRKIGDLVSLMYLNLSCSSFGNHIPSTISRLSKLRSLDLSSNYELRLDESTWSKLIGNTTNLEKLVLDDVDMSSISETSLSLLMNFSSSLLFLSLADTGLHGRFPTAILGLPNLGELNLYFNEELKCELPKSNWSNPLRSLDLSDTVFSEQIPNSVSHLKSLNQLRLHECQFDGLIPVSLWNLTQLTQLDLSGNKLHGEISSLLSNLKHVTFLDLSHNTFSGHIPDVFDNFTKLDFLILSSNSLGGQIPYWFRDNLLHTWKSMYLIDLSFNQLQGDLPIPPNGINYFSVSNNNFTGGISSTICNASSLNMLILSHNNLTGKIPQCLGSFPSLQVLDFQINNFYGSLPENFSKSNDFATIKLSGNHLEGPVPQSSQKHPFPKLRIFDVSSNKFSGLLPMQYFQEFQGMMTLNDNTQIGGLEYMSTNPNTSIAQYNDSVMIIMKGQLIEMSRILTIFTTIDLSNNMFEGEIPQILGELNSLKGLNLSHNKISGMIPQTLGNLTSLEWLDLSWNQLKGEIPLSLTNLNFLSVLNLSENQLMGEIPTGKQFNTFQNDSYRGNPMLCGFPLSKSCSNDEEQPPSVFPEAKESLFGWKSVAVGYGCEVEVFGMFLGRLFIKTAKPLWLARLICGYT
ncbi:Receptor-like protein [Arachis hypogaea]|nr:Receptor-like protein [Arachis hypogaea]